MTRLPHSPTLDLIDALAQSIAGLAEEVQEAVEELRREDQTRGDDGDPAD